MTELILLGRAWLAGGTVRIWSASWDHQAAAGGGQQLPHKAPSLSAWVCGGASNILCSMPPGDAGITEGIR